MFSITKNPYLFLLIFVLLFSSFTTGQKFPPSTHKFSLHSGLHSNPGGDFLSAYSNILNHPNSEWIRLHFGSSELGEKSYIKITSLDNDEHWQILTKQTLNEWGNTSSYIKGSSIKVDLYVAPFEEFIFFEIEEISYSFGNGNNDIPQTICGTDNRFLSYDAAVGRIIYNGNVVGTAWIYTNGKLVTAGHVLPGNCGTETYVVEFAYSSTIGSGGPSKQFVVDCSSVDYHSYSDYAEWSVFDVHLNANTGLHPIVEQNKSYSINKNDIYNGVINGTPLTGVSVTGYGLFNTGHPQSKDTGPITDYNSYEKTIGYLIDTNPASSGSPVIWSGNVIGVHTNGQCHLGTTNKGVSVRHDYFESSLLNNLKYVKTLVRQTTIGGQAKGQVGRWWNNEFKRAPL